MSSSGNFSPKTQESTNGNQEVSQGSSNDQRKPSQEAPRASKGTRKIISTMPAALQPPRKSPVKKQWGDSRKTVIDRLRVLKNVLETAEGSIIDLIEQKALLEPAALKPVIHHWGNETREMAQSLESAEEERIRDLKNALDRDEKRERQFQEQLAAQETEYSAVIQEFSSQMEEVQEELKADMKEKYRQRFVEKFREGKAEMKAEMKSYVEKKEAQWKAEQQKKEAAMKAKYEKEMADMKAKYESKIKALEAKSSLPPTPPSEASDAEQASTPKKKSPPSPPPQVPSSDHRPTSSKRKRDDGDATPDPKRTRTDSQDVNRNGNDGDATPNPPKTPKASNDAAASEEQPPQSDSTSNETRSPGVKRKRTDDENAHHDAALAHSTTLEASPHPAAPETHPPSPKRQRTGGENDKPLARKKPRGTSPTGKKKS